MPKLSNFLRTIQKLTQLNLGIILLIVLVFLNITEFPQLEKSRSNPNWKAIYQFESGNLINIGLLNNEYYHHRYDPALILGYFAPGSTITIPDSGKISAGSLKAYLLSYGKASEVKAKTYDPEILIKNFDPSQYFTFVGDEDYRGVPFAIAVSEHFENEFLFLVWQSPVTGTMDLLIDPHLLPDEYLQEIN